MGLFSTIKSNWGKAHAASIVQGLLEALDKQGLYAGDPAAVANHLVGAVWELDPPLFDGKTGPKPHKASIAAYSLAFGIQIEPRRQSGLRETLCVALAMVMDEFRRNGAQYPFHHVDNMLIGKAADVFGQVVAEDAEHIESEGE